MMRKRVTLRLWLICCGLNAAAAAGLFALCVFLRAVIGLPVDLPVIFGGILIGALLATPLLGWFWAAAYVDRHNRRIPPWACKKCGYDLTGNVSGVCPECGTTVTQAL